MRVLYLRADLKGVRGVIMYQATSEKLVVTPERICVGDQFPCLEKIEHFFN